jgi:uncharacterized membrane protein HdeD (DUF308 family)
MRLILSVAGILLTVIGLVWFLQGINVLPGSFMTGQIRWAVFGVLAIIAGVSLVARVNRRR